jgi:aquaporin Z
MTTALKRHWPEYLMEAAGLGAFMVSATAFATLLFHPASPLSPALGGPVSRRLLMGLAMGLTAITLIYSPWGQQSGAHFNPAMTLTFFRLGKVAGWDTVFYVAAQGAGGVAGMTLAALLLRGFVADPAVNYVATVPGPRGAGVAFVAELAISLGLMTVVLAVSNSARAGRLTGLCAGALVALYITAEAPLSGMSMNPARTFASALAGDVWTALWVYLAAPLLGMLLAAEVRVRLRGAPAKCAKLDHANTRRCIFRCGYAPALASGGVASAPGLEKG